ncbi:MAG TPA: hypothetical protein VLJ18_00375 [Thermoanaerobaculia bacterium]|nr:hypothetical protein [Thermoanaerobaculia bacterium]
MSTGFRLFASFGTIALFAACGFALTSFVPSLRRKPLGRRLAWAYLLGLAYVGVSLYALSHWAGFELRRGMVLAVSTIPIALAAWGGRLVDVERERPRARMFRIQRVACVVAACAGALVSLAVLAHAVSSVESGFDPRMTWNPAAVYVRVARAVSPPALLDASVYLQNPRYPLLLPVLQVAGEEVFDTDDDERVPRPLYAVLLPVLLLLVFDVARPFAGTLAAALAVLAVTFLPAVAFYLGGGAITSYSDLPMGLLWGSGLVLIFRSPRGSAEGLAGGLLLGGAALAKAEGLLLAAVVVAIASTRAARRLIRRRRRKLPWRPEILRAPAGALAVFLFAAALHVSWRAGIPNRYSETWDDVTVRGLISGTAARLPAALRLIGREMARPEIWSGFWWLAAAVFVLEARAFRHPLARLFAYAIAGALCVYLAAYGASSWAPEDLVPKTWNRFLCQLSLPVFVLFAMALGQALREFHRPAVA